MGLLLAVLVFLAGCEDTGTPPPVDPPQIAGSWSGSVTMSGQTFAASFTHTQSGVSVGGTATIDQLLPTSPIEGAIDAAGKVILLIENGCETWLSQLTVAADEEAMAGPIQVDRVACAQGLDDAGAISLTRD